MSPTCRFGVVWIWGWVWLVVGFLGFEGYVKMDLAGRGALCLICFCGFEVILLVVWCVCCG